MSDERDQVRKSVSEFYARTVTAGGSCCGPALPKGVAAKAAGYTAEELGALPPDAVANSFGCGNPLAFSEVEPGQTVLDLGSGAGIDLLIAAGKVGPTGRVIGVDMTDEMITRARRNAADAGFSNVEVRRGIIEELPVENASVDWVISNCVINLSPEKDRVFAEIARILKPGGRVRVSDIVAHDLPEWVRQDSTLHSSCVAGAISEAEYVDGLRRAGLVGVEVSARIPYDAAQMAAFVGSDEPEAGGGGCCCGSGRKGGDEADVARIVEATAGKVWSARFHARKPD